MRVLFMTCCVICLSLLLPPAQAYKSYQARIPNGNNVPHPCKVNHMWPGVGHQQSGGGGTRNAFGQDFAAAGHKWTTELCRKDSDGDGMSNGQELGDPSCVWVQGQTPSRVSDISHPGVCTPYNSTQCRGRDNFVSCEKDRFEKCDALRQPGVMSQDLRFPPIEVPDTETNYFCMTFDLDLPPGQDFHMIANEGLIDNAEVMHHILLYGCEDDSQVIPAPQDCSMASTTSRCSNIVGFWTLGKPGICHSNNTGFRIGASGYTRFRMESHYNNPMKTAGMTDASGLRVYYQSVQPGVEDLATLMMGQAMLEIPPGKARVEQSGTCPGRCTRQYFTESLYVTYALNHAHYMGIAIKADLFRNGTFVHTLSNDSSYNYDSPQDNWHDPPVEIRPGDEVRTTCVYNSLSSDRYVYYGDGTQDEMCYAFFIAYPARAAQSTHCVSLGEISQCDWVSGSPLGDCDWAMFLNQSRPETRAILEPLRKNCNLNGFCRPECQKVVDEVNQHPCFSGQYEKTVKELLLQLDEDKVLDLFGRLHSCPRDGGHVDCSDQCSEICGKSGNGVAGTTEPAAAMTVLLTACSLVRWLL